MKNIKLKSSVANVSDMNELVDTVCAIVGKDSAAMRDKFKMVTNANSKTLNDLCKFLNLKVEFDYTGKINTVSVFMIVKDSFKLGDKPSEKENGPEETPEPISNDKVNGGKIDNKLDVNKSDADDDDEDPF